VAQVASVTLVRSSILPWIEIPATKINTQMVTPTPRTIKVWLSRIFNLFVLSNTLGDRHTLLALL
jgi:hypothetical protein